MKSTCWLVVLVGLFSAAPLLAQDRAPAEQPTPGLVVVGHGPDVPNGEPQMSSPCDEASQPGSTCASSAGQVPVMVVVVPVPVVVPAVRGHHHRGSAVVDPVPNDPAQANPVGQFINDPSRRFINDPSRRFINPPVSRPDPKS